MIPILQKEKLRHREIEWADKGHLVELWWYPKFFQNCQKDTECGVSDSSLAVHAEDKRTSTAQNNIV